MVREYFIVTSHGWSASNWVAYSLNLNPNITCAHSSAAIIANSPSELDGDGLRKNLRQLRRGYVRRRTYPINSVYEDLERQCPSPVVGTVHTFRLRDLPLQEDRFGSGSRKYRTVNLVRHPLDLVVSGYGQFLTLFRIDLNEFSWTLRKVVEQGLDVVEEICDRHGLTPGDYEVLCFFAACLVLGSLKLDIDAQRLIATKPAAAWGYSGQVQMEEVTQSPKAFAGLVKLLSNRSDLTTDDYLDAVFKSGPINVHNPESPRGTKQRWAQLAEWQREAFIAFLTRFSLREPYEEFGYDFSFMDHQ